jgi:CNT family concentrative nucleoside transporter
MGIIGILGLFAFMGLAWIFSTDRKKINWKTVGAGFLLQIVFAILILGIPAVGLPGLLRPFFIWANDAIMALIAFSDEGTRFLFGPLADPAQAGGFIVAVKVLPTIIFFSTVMAVFYHLGLMQFIVRSLARVMHKTMGISAAESLSASGNIFVGQTEAPLLIRPYLAKMTRSELMSVMTGGMATVAGGVMAAYVQLLSARIPDIAGHLLTASVMSAPAALLFAKILLPETETPETIHSDTVTVPSDKANVIDAAASGAADGLKLALNVGAMLLAFIALVALVNGLIGSIGGMLGLTTLQGQPLTFQYFLGWVFTPFAFLMGIPWEECFLIGQMLGEKIVLNEFVAYVSLSQQAASLSDRAVIIASYALCGFANISSIAIQIGGIGGIAPERRSELSRLGIKSVAAGSLAAFMTAAIAGVLL